MLAFLLGLFRLIWLFGKGHHVVLLENLALRQQLAIYKRKQIRPRLVGQDRWFWIALSVVWKDWRRALCVVHPDTVVRWQRGAFPPVLGEPVEEVRKTGSTARQPSGPHVDSKFGTSKSLVACAAHSRRVAEARNRGFRTDRVARLADRQAAAVADLEDLPPESHRGDRRH